MKLLRSSVALKLVIGIGICVLTMAAVTIFEIHTLARLESLYREALQRATDMETAAESAHIGEDLHKIIDNPLADGNSATLEREWERGKAQSRERLRQIASIAVVPEEKARIEEAQREVDNLIRIYEKEMLPLKVSGRGDPQRLSLIDARIDKTIGAIETAMRSVAHSKLEVNRQASAQFHGFLTDSARLIQFVSLSSVMVALSILFLMSRRFVRTLSELTGAAREMEEGRYRVAINHSSDDELGVLANAFRSMSEQVKRREEALTESNVRLQQEMSERQRAEEELRELNVALERRVAARTAELTATVDSLRTEIEERAIAENALRSSEQRYALVVEGASDGIWDWDLASGEAYMSPRLKEILGYADDELPNHVDEWRSRIYREDRVAVERALDEYLTGREPTYGLEYRLVHRDGSCVWVLARGVCLRDAMGRAYRMAGSIKDITNRKLAEEALQRSERLLRIVFELLPVGVWMVDRKGDAVMINRACKKIWCGDGYRQVEIDAELTGWLSESGQQLNSEDWPLERALSRGETTIGRVIEIQCLDGSRKFIVNSAVPVVDNDSNITAAVAVYEDITAHRRAEEQMQLYNEQLRNLSARLEQSREQERARIAREIHDELGQLLTVLKFDVSWLKKRLPAEGDVMVAKVDSMRELIDSTIRTVQRIATELRTELLDDVGLSSAIEWYASRFQERTGIDCALDLEADTLPLDPQCTTALFRICQEALTNVMRHSGATRAEISLRKRRNGIEMRIGDNGRGIERRAIGDPLSVGLIGMRERTIHCGGAITITGKSGAGTTVKVTIPSIATGRME